VIAHKKESYDPLFPMEQYTKGDVDAKFPKGVLKLFDAETNGEVPGFKCADEGVNMPLNFDSFVGVKMS
jgi:hypothetical protein